MHLPAERESSDARLKMKALVEAFLFSLILRVVSQYAIGILWVRTTARAAQDSQLFTDLRTGIL